MQNVMRQPGRTIEGYVAIPLLLGRHHEFWNGQQENKVRIIVGSPKSADILNVKR